MSSSNLAPEGFDEAQETKKFRTQMGHISRHSGVFFIGTIFRIGAGYLFKVYLARTLGPEPLGIYALGMTIVTFLGIFNSLGFPHAAVRFVAHYVASGKVAQLRQFLISATGLLLAANLVLGLTMLWVGPWVAVRFYHTPALTAYLKLFAAIMVLGVLTTFFGRVLQGYKEVARLTIITDFVGTPITMLLSIILIVRGKGLWGYVFAQVVNAAVVLMLMFRLIRKLTPTDRTPISWGLPERQVVTFSTTLIGIGVLNFLISQSDKVLLGYYSNAKQLGIYAVAAAVVAYIPIALQSVNQIFSPTIADLYTRGEHQLLERLYQNLTRWILGFSLPLAIVIMVFARPLMRIFGPEFEAGWVVLVIGAVGQLVNCGAGSVGFLLLMSGHERKLVKVQLRATILTVSVGLLLVPNWGITGAAVVAALTTVLTNAWSLLEVRRNLGFGPYNRRSWRQLAPTAASALVVLSLRATLHNSLPAITSVMLALLLAYATFLAVTALMGFDENDRLMGRAVWSRVKGFFPTIDLGV